MERRASFPSIAAMAVLAALAAAGSGVSPPAKAQDQQGGDLAARVNQLEQRIQDMQAVIGTLQTFVQNGGAAPGAQGASGPLPGGPGVVPGGAGGGPSEVSIQVQALETQVRALTDQVSQISARLDQFGAGGATSGLPLQQDDPLAQQAPQPDQQPGGGPYGESAPQGEQMPWAQQGQSAPRQQPRQGQSSVPQFGTSTSRAGQDNPFARPEDGSGPGQPGGSSDQAGLSALSGLSGGAGGARGLYDAAYQSYLQNDFQSAEQGFREFVETYPDNQLASNAYYWLGRVHFDRSQFEPAAKAFLAGYKSNKQSRVAPDSLLHLGMSLAQLGEKDAACSTLSAVGKQFPDASAQFKQKAESALKRAKC